MIYVKLFLSFLQIGLFSIGGGYAAMPLIQSQTVTKHGWLSMNEFTDLITIAEMTPGPIAVNSATFVGIRVAGFGGALVATFGCILPSLIIVSLLYFVYSKYKNLPVIQSVLQNLRPAVVALIASAGIAILLQVAFGGEQISFHSVNWLGLILFAVSLLILRKLKPSPIIVIAGCGAIGLIAGLI